MSKCFLIRPSHEVRESGTWVNLMGQIIYVERALFDSATPDKAFTVIVGACVVIVEACVGYL